MALRILIILSDSGMAAPATFTDLSPDRDLSLCGVRNTSSWIRADLLIQYTRGRAWRTITVAT